MRTKWVTEKLLELGGEETSEGFPYIDSPVFKTTAGTRYLKGPGVVMVNKPHVDLSGTIGFLEGYGLGFESYLQDDDVLADGERLAKFGAQLCYMSFGEHRTKNVDAARYFENIKSSGHGSVIEHPGYSFLLYGLSRDQTHELVRHRVGCGYSQQSQRYVGGQTLRFVERREYQTDALQSMFERFIDMTATEYEQRAEVLLRMQLAGDPALAATSDSHAKTEMKKKVRQVARSVLTNEVEAPILVTMNARSGRHVSEMRAAAAADTAIRETMFRTFLCMALVDPLLFNDYELDMLKDGTSGISTKYRKV
jgi:thymidylate synthase (FAD)